MMEMIGQWLLGMIGTIILIAIADSVMPSGGAKQVGKLTCGMVLLLMMVKPVMELSPESWASMQDSWQVGYGVDDMEKYYNLQLKTIIEQQLETYIVDKAMEQGIFCSPEVACVLGAEGVYQPFFVEFDWVSQNQRPFLITLVQRDLGIEETAIIFKEVLEDEVEISPNE